MISDGIGAKGVVWWGRSDISYSRNGVMRSAMRELGLTLFDFKPRCTLTGHIEAKVSSGCNADFVWVPCFRQRDVVSASKWAKKMNIPLVFDPLISAYDKQVFERSKFSPNSKAAKRLLRWESQLFQLADVLIADTRLHAQYYQEQFGVQLENIFVIPVGAEEKIFHPIAAQESAETSKYQVLFYGNYLELHGVDTICDAILQTTNASVEWTLVGDGPMKERAVNACGALPNVHFVGWEDCAYEALPSFIHKANLVLGIFGSGDKASRVIPNKVYQAIACGRPVLTMRSEAYPSDVLASTTSGFHWVEKGNASALVNAVEAAINSEQEKENAAAFETYVTYFSKAKVEEALGEALVYASRTIPK